MKKRKPLLRIGIVIVLAMVLITISISTSTFSWFIRPNGSSGNSLTYQIPYKDASGADENMVAYDGSGVTMSTYVSTDDGISFSDTAAAPATSGTLGTQPYDLNNPTARSNRVYYKTTLTNNNSTPQNVSLYIKNFKTGSTGNVCVGVNEPIKAFKNYSQYGLPKPAPSKNTSSGGTDKRIYFETNTDTENWRPSDGGFRVYYASSNVSSNSSYKSLTKCPDRTNMYYADLPASANQAFFTSKNNDGSTSFLRSQTFTNLSGDGLSSTQSLLFKNAKWYDKTYNNLHIDVQKTDGAYISEYYNAASLGKGETLELGLTSAQYGGTSIAYFVVSGSSCINLNTEGTVTATAAGTAKIRYTVQSQHSETVTKDCTITVKDYSSGSDITIQAAPIVTNLLIPGTNANASSNDHNNVQDVYWFIQNGDEMYGAAGDEAHYQLDEIYLGL